MLECVSESRTREGRWLALAVDVGTTDPFRIVDRISRRQWVRGAREGFCFIRKAGGKHSVIGFEKVNTSRVVLLVVGACEESLKKVRPTRVTSEFSAEATEVV